MTLTLQDTEKLVAFTLGFVSHQVADVTWHSLGINQGFLTTMGDVNFFGSFPAAHSIGDPGGDMVASFEGDTRQLNFVLMRIAFCRGVVLNKDMGMFN